jgi:hypothetical protein
MSENFTRENKTLEREIAAATTNEELADVLLRFQRANGLPTRVDRVALPSRSGDSSSQPSASVPVESSGGAGNCVRYLYYGNDRYELCGASEAELDAREKVIAASYGKK